MGFFESIGAFFASLPSELYVFLISILPIVELRGAIPVGAALQVPFYINYPLSIIGNLLPVPFILLFIPKILDFLMRFKLFRPVVVWLRKKANKHKGKVLGEEKSGEAGEAHGDLAELSDTALADEVIDTSIPEEANDATDEAKKAAPIADGALSKTAAIESECECKSLNSKNTVMKMTKGIFLALFLFVAIPAPGTGAWTGGLIASLFNLPKRSSFLAIFLGVILAGVVMCLASYGVLGFLSFLL